MRNETFLRIHTAVMKRPVDCDDGDLGPSPKAMPLHEPFIKATTRPHHNSHNAVGLLPFVVGIVCGLSVSSVFLLLPASVHRRGSSDGTLGTGNGPLVGLKDPQLLQQFYLQQNRIADLSREVELMEPLYYGVLVSDVEQMRLVRETWAGEREVEFFLPVGDDSRPELEPGPSRVVRLNGAVDQHSLHYKAIGHICDKKINGSKHFFLSTDRVYVNTDAMELYLANTERPGERYEGLPEMDAGGVCSPEAGVVLSRSSMLRVCGALEECSAGSSLWSSCVPNVIQCSSGAKVFSRITTLALQDQNMEKMLHVDQAHILNPVDSARLMHALHRSVLSAALDRTKHKAHLLKVAIDWMDELLPHLGTNKFRNVMPGELVSSRNDIMSWEFLSRKDYVSDKQTMPVLSVPAIWKDEVNYLMQKTTDYLNVRVEEGFSFKRYSSVYWQLNPSTGLQYIVDFEAEKKKGDNEEPVTSPARNFHVTLTRPFDPPIVSPFEFSSRDKVLNIAVFLSPDLLEAFQGFMKMLSVVLEHDQDIGLYAVVMASTNQPVDGGKNLMDPKSILSLYQSKYPRANFRVIDSPHVLSRAHGITIVARACKPEEALFLADLGLEFDTSFIQRCRSFPLLGQQAYFPSLFSKYSPSLLASMNHTLMEERISQHAGHWMTWSHSVACLHAGDLLGGTATDHAIDMEAVYKSLVERGYQVIQGVDKGLKRRHAERCQLHGDVNAHHKSCSRNHSNQYIRTQLASLLFHHEGEQVDSRF